MSASGDDDSLSFPAKTASSLRPELAMDFFCDESSQNGHTYLVLGALAVFRARVPAILEALSSVRHAHNHRGEFGWTSVSNYKFGAYVGWVDTFAEFARKQHLRFTALILNTKQVNQAWNEGDRELGFNKLLYQLLLHRVGRPYGDLRPIDGYLDSRTTKHSPDELRDILNAGLGKQYGISTEPFRRIQFRDSKRCDLIQLVDVLTGAVAFHMNGHAKKVGTRPQKIELCEKLRKLRRTDAAVRRQFDLWKFNYRRRSRRA